jgi:transposase
MSDTELLFKPKPEPEPVRRLEVFTGAGRRSAGSAEQKARIVSETFDSANTNRNGSAQTRYKVGRLWLNR